MLYIIKIHYGIWFFMLLPAKCHHLVLQIKTKFYRGRGLSVLEDTSVHRTLHFWRAVPPLLSFRTVIKDHQVNCTQRETETIVKRFQMTGKKQNCTRISCCTVVLVFFQCFFLKQRMLASKIRCSHLPILPESWFSLHKPHTDLYFDSGYWEIFIAEVKEKGESATRYIT